MSASEPVPPVSGAPEGGPSEGGAGEGAAAAAAGTKAGAAPPPEPRETSPLLAQLEAGLRAGATGGLAAGVGELAVVLLRGTGAGFFGLAGFFAYALLLLGLAGAVLGGLLGLLVALLAPGAGPRALGARWAAARARIRAARGGAEDVRRAAWVWAGVLAVGGWSGALFFVSYTAIRRFHAPGLIAALVTATALGLTLAAVPGALVVKSLAERLLSRLAPVPRRLPIRSIEGTIAILLVLGVLEAGAAAFVLRDTIIHLDLWPLVIAAVWAVVAVVAWLRRAARPAAPRPLSRRARAGVAVAIAAALVAAAGPLPAVPAVRGVAAGEARLVRFLSTVLAAASDLDRDGHGFLFGGRDCAPFTRSINPDATEIPGNGVDENCRGGDGPSAAASALAGGPKYAPLPPGMDREWNFIIISVDTLRADRLGAYGYAKNPTSPELDRLAAESVLFENAICHGAGTSTSMPSLLTGRYFSNAPLDEKAFLVPNADTIAWRLRNAGWVTGGAFALGDWTGFNYKEGIEHADLSPSRGNSNESETSDRVTDRALDFLNAHGSDRFMMWLHYYDPHHNYIKHAPPAHFGTGRDDLYDAEIRFTDIHLGRLLAALRASPRWNDTVIVFTADHGESLGDHKGQAHGNTLYWEISHVPLIVRVPGAAPRRSKGAVAHVDVMPTVLNLAGLDADEEGEGKTLVPEIFAGSDDPARIVFSEVHTGYFSLTRIMSAFRPPWHLVYNYSHELTELYDTRADPAEKNDVASAHPDVVGELRGALEGFIAATSKDKFAAEVTANVMPLAAAVPKIPLKATFGGIIEVLGYDPCDFIEPGKKCHMALYLHPLAPIPDHYVATMWARGPHDNRDLSHVPVDGLHPTPRWKVGEAVRDNFRWWLPRKAKSQMLSVTLGFTGPDGRKLTTADGKTEIEITKVEHRGK